MREIIARIISVLTLVMVVALSLLFASAHNRDDRIAIAPSGPAPAPAARELITEPVPPVTPAEPVQGASPMDSARGRAVYERQNCATCHSIAGEGNPRYPLDGVGANWNAREMEDWITGQGDAADVLPSAIVKRKQRYQKLARDDMDALVSYLSGLKPPE